MNTDTKRVAADDPAPTPTLRRLRDTEQTVSSSDADIRGRMVKDEDGKDVGEVEGLMVDDAEQKVRFNDRKLPYPRIGRLRHSSWSA